MDIQVNVLPNFVNLAQTLLATTILFLILRHFLFKPVTNLLEKRRNYIESGVANKVEAEKQLEKINEDYELKMIEAREESSEIISSARKYSEELKSKAVAESKALAQQEYDKGIRNLENERIKTMKSMNDEIVEIAMAATEKVLREKSTNESDKKMVQSLILDLEKSHE